MSGMSGAPDLGISTLRFVLRVNEQDARRVQQRCSTWFHTRLKSRLAMLGLDDGAGDWRIDRLVLDVGDVRLDELEAQLEERIVKQLTGRLRQWRAQVGRSSPLEINGAGIGSEVDGMNDTGAPAWTQTTGEDERMALDTMTGPGYSPAPTQGEPGTSPRPPLQQFDTWLRTGYLGNPGQWTRLGPDAWLLAQLADPGATGWRMVLAGRCLDARALARLLRTFSAPTLRALGRWLIPVPEAASDTALREGPAQGAGLQLVCHALMATGQLSGPAPARSSFGAIQATWRVALEHGDRLAGWPAARPDHDRGNDQGTGQEHDQITDQDHEPALEASTSDAVFAALMSWLTPLLRMPVSDTVRVSLLALRDVLQPLSPIVHGWLASRLDGGGAPGRVPTRQADPLRTPASKPASKPAANTPVSAQEARRLARTLIERARMERPAGDPTADPASDLTAAHGSEPDAAIARHGRPDGLPDTYDPTHNPAWPDNPPALHGQPGESDAAPGVDDAVGPWTVSNAGLVLLWPLLPGLMRMLDLVDADGQFVSDAARLEAVTCLDWLAWGDARNPAAPEWRTPLTRLLCGVPLEDTAGLADWLDMAPLEPARRDRLDAWLGDETRALPGLSRCELNDIRELFLQRPGTLLPVRRYLELHVETEAVDILLAELPWPLTQVMLPWLPDVLPVSWPT
ncbi:contractile injection system tape measure protein [Paraburkholderia aspalathi]|uniref:contractile injection system tape measure protein n=1 Tax=Paraburkholderia aspalathi TaxID=1324617 RepID=UPI0038B6DD92